MKNKLTWIMILYGILLLGVILFVSYYKLEHWQSPVTTAVWVLIIFSLLHTIYFALKHLIKYIKR